MRRGLSIAGGLGALIAAYVAWVRPRQMRWGATDEETQRPLPCDELVPRPTWNATRALTVEATPEEIWPWIVQIGWGRAGWYGYDWADNGGKPSAWEIVPEHQRLEVGSAFPMSPWTAMYCHAFEEPRWMLWMGIKRIPAPPGAGTFLWYLDPIDERRTRLMIRMRDEYRWFNPFVLVPQLLVDVFDIFFQWKCLLGVKARAERMARENATARRGGVP